MVDQRKRALLAKLGETLRRAQETLYSIESRDEILKLEERKVRLREKVLLDDLEKLLLEHRISSNGKAGER